MARYRIVKVPALSGLKFYVEIHCESWMRSTGICTHKQEWKRLDIDGDPVGSEAAEINRGLSAFKTIDMAKEYIESLISFQSEETTVVYDTLTSNSPKETGT